MTRVDPIRRIWPLARARRRAAPEASPEPPVVNVTINLGPETATPSRTPTGPAASLDAHMLAQGARARGLRGGHKLLQTARSVYLSTEWSGPNDRRVKTGRITKTEA